MREKLIELLDVGATIANNICGGIDCDDCDGYKNGCTLTYIADHLIANGVTIPVRCKECTHSSNNGLPDDRVFCRLLSKYMDVDGFCHNGERRTDETKTD